MYLYIYLVISILNFFRKLILHMSLGLLGPLQTTLKLKTLISRRKKHARFGYTNVTYD